MKSGAVTSSLVLSKDARVVEDEWDGMLKSALYFNDVMYSWMTLKLCSDYKIAMQRMPKLPSDKLNAFRAANRMSLVNSVSEECHQYHPVLEMVLSKNHMVGSRFSRRYTVIVECPDQKELVPLPLPPPKGTVEMLSDSVQQIVKTVTLQASEPEPEKSRWVETDSQVFEIHLTQDGPIRTHRLSKQVSVFARRASLEEVRPYPVEFHISQKAWYERLMIWLTQRAESAHFPPQCGSEWDEAIVASTSMDSFPGEIEVVSRDQSKPAQNDVKAAPSMDGIWIPDFDVALGVSSDVASTVATEIMKRKVVPFFGSKEDLRPSQVHVMTLMLQEELKDDDHFVDLDLPMANFWMKISDCSEEIRKKEDIETKWLKKDNGDFMGPFVHATEEAIHKAAVEWVMEYAREHSKAPVEEPRDPEPSVCIHPLFTEEAPEKIDNSPRQLPQQEKPAEIVPFFSSGGQHLFKLTGPIETLDQKAKELCQDWVNDSKTLLIKAAKKTLIDSFQADFHSFLFLFQLQLKRIKGGDKHGIGSDTASQADDTSWVSADPSVEEEDTRVADIEYACIAFMNQMGNNMVRHYELLSGDKADPEQEQRDEDAEEISLSESKGRSIEDDRRRQFGQGSLSGSVYSKTRQARFGRNGFVPDPALIMKDGMSKINPAETSLTLSEASTVRGKPNRSGVKIRSVRQSVGRPRLPPSSSRRRRHEEEDDRDEYTDEDGSLISQPTDEESLEETLDSFDEEDDFSYRRWKRNRKHRRRGDRYDYDSPFSGSDDDTAESITLSPSELSFHEAKPKPSSWGSWTQWM